MVSRPSLPLVALGIAMAAMFLPSAAIASESYRLRLSHIDDSKFPQVEAYVSVSDLGGVPIRSLTQEAFTLHEDNLVIGALKVSSVQQVQIPLAVALVMDSSSLMWTKDAPTPLAKSAEAASSFLDQLNADDQVSIVQFSGQVEVLSPLSADKYPAKQALASLQPQDKGRVMYDGIVEGIGTLSGFSGRRVVVLITNGRDTYEGVHGLDGAVREAQSAGIPIFALAFGEGVSVQQLTDLTGQSGGLAYIKQTQYDMRSAFDALLRLLREQYVLSYISALPADGSQHEVEVRTQYKGEEQRTSARFLAKSSSLPVSLPELEPSQSVGGLVRFAPSIDWPAPLSSVELVLDGALLDAIPGPPYEYEWNSVSSNTSSGPHEFVVQATDIAGNTGETRITLNIQPPITIDVLTPAAGSVVDGPTLLSANIVAFEGVVVEKVEFMVDGQLLDTLTAPPYQVEWNAPRYGAGPHSLGVTAYDTRGLFTTATQVNLSVEVGAYSWMVPIVILAVAALVIPFAVRARRRLRGGQTVPIAAGQAILREIEGINPGQVWPLGNSEIRLGRKRDENDIPLKGRFASRRHATITVGQGGYVINNLSPNPILINGGPATLPHALQPGDLVQIDETTLRYER